MNAALAEASTYHDLGANGFFAVRAYGEQTLHRLADMPRVLERLPIPPDLQISQAEYRSPRNRTKANVLRIGLNFVDCDIYKSRFAHLTPEQIAWTLRLFCEDNGIPRPNLINFSGRGAHVKWRLDGSLPAAALVRWGCVQKTLGKRLADFGADMGALDASRCLRAAGTINVKSGQLARTVWEDNARWDFDALAGEVLPYTREQVDAYKQAQAAHKAARAANPQTDVPRKCNLWTIEDLWCHRLEDVRRLIALRGWTNGVPEGFRNHILFVATTALFWSLRPSDLEAEARELARQFCPSLSPAEVRSAVCSVTARAREGKPYRLRTQTILDMLKIVPGEQRHLRTLYNRADRPQRHREQNRKHSDRQTYEANAQQRRELAQALRGQGLTYSQIAAQMETTTNAIDKLLRRR